MLSPQKVKQHGILLTEVMNVPVQMVQSLKDGVFLLQRLRIYFQGIRLSLSLILQ